jgi:hypothetical protein
LCFCDFLWLKRPTESRVIYSHANRDVERQLAEGPPREGHMVARPRQA